MPKHSPDDWAKMPSTHWSLIGRVQDEDLELRSEALGEFLQRYLPALRAHLIWRKRLDRDFSEDVLQSFIANKVLERDLMSTADRRLGKFRTLLLRSLENFTIDELRKLRPDQRAGGGAVEITAVEQRLKPSREQPSDEFELAWAQRVLVETLERTRNDCLVSGDQRTWEIFENRVIAPALDPHVKPIPYEQLLARYQLDSPQQAANVLLNAKRRFRRHLEATVSQYAAPGDVQHEIMQLRRIAATSGGQRLDMLDVTRAVSHRDLAFDSDFDLIDPLRFPDPFAEELFGSPWQESELATIIRDQLATPVTVYLPDAAPGQLPFPESTLMEMLLHPAPPLHGLRKLKEYARNCARELVPGILTPEIASVIYTVSIAAALNRHAARITKSGDEVLAVSFRMVRHMHWVPEELKQLLDQALRSLDLPDEMAL